MVEMGTAILVSGLILTLAGEIKDIFWLKIGFKPIASIGFLWVAFFASSSMNPFVAFIWTALILSWLGDIFLLGQSKPLFLTGLAFFLSAHLAYSAAFLNYGILWTRAVFIIPPLLILVLGVIRWLAPYLGPQWKTPVFLYMGAISIMVLFAYCCPWERTSIFFIWGATLFFISDLLVARHRFVKKEAMNRILGLPLYYAGQWLFAMSLFYI